MVQSSSSSPAIKSDAEQWSVERFISWAGLLALIYLCVNVVYHQGYLYKFGIEFGFFSITRTLPIFDNFLLAAYSFFLWAVFMGTSLSTYDQFFALFNVKSWRDNRVTAHRLVALALILLIYFGLHLVYLQKDNWDLSMFLSRVSPDTGKELALRLLWPTWGFLTWGGSLLAILLLLAFFLISNWRYRVIRSSGLQQIIGNNINLMMFHLDIVSPTAMILGALFFLIMLPASYGKAMADISLAKIHSGGQQEIDLIELEGTKSFCDEEVQRDEQAITWNKSPDNDFTIHLLGHWGEMELFAKINKQNITRPLSKADYSICMVSSSAVKTIVFAQGTSVP